MADPLDEGGEERSGVDGGMLDDLTRQEAVLRRDVALDVEEAQHPVGVPVRQHEAGQPAHRMAREMEPPDPERVAGADRRLRQERDRQDVRTFDCRVAEAGGVEHHQVPTGEGGMQREVGVVLLGRAEAVQADQRRRMPLAPQAGDLQRGLCVAQRQSVWREVGHEGNASGESTLVWGYLR